eukprot:1053878_1
MSNLPIAKPNKLSSKVSMWENAFKPQPQQQTKSKQKITRRKHRLSSFFEGEIQTTQHAPTHTRVSSLDTDRLKRFISSGEKYFKILIEPIPVYREKLLRIPKHVCLHKGEIVAGTYVNNKIVLLADPYHGYCNASHVEPVDIDHMRASVQQESQKFNEMYSTVQQQLDEMKTKSSAQQETKQTEQTEPAFVSEDEFANNIVNGQKPDKFIHIQIDDNDPKQIQSAMNLASTRAFQSRFVAPIIDITKGKAFGEMSLLLPSGLTNKYTFNAKQTVYRGTATIKVKETSAKTFTCDVYFDVNFNLICRTNDVNSSKVSFTADDGTVSCAMDNSNASVNGLYQDVTKKLQHKYLVKMDESDKINKVYHSEIIPESDVLKITTTKPKESCRAYFTGGVVGQESVAYKIDAYSEYVGQGEYPKNREAFPKAVANTFDGIAIDRNTRVVIYEKENFEGEILLDARGPKIVNNGTWKNDSRYDHCNTDIFPDPELQKNFPIDVRIWTDTNMHQWSYGSVKILSNAGGL